MTNGSQTEDRFGRQKPGYTDQDVHSIIGWSKILEHGVDALFDGRTWASDDQEFPIKVSDYWTWPDSNSDSDGSVKCPTGTGAVAIYSKQAFNAVAWRTKLPELADTQEAWMGMEADSTMGVGLAAFCWRQAAGEAEKMYIGYGGAFAHSIAEITAAAPANAKTARHVYSIYIKKSYIEFYIDDGLVGIVMNAPMTLPTVAYPPYVVVAPNVPIAQRLLPLVEAVGMLTELVFPLHPHGFRAAESPDLALPIFPFYTTGTTSKWTGLAIAAAVTSHPIPGLGYSQKDLYFKAGASGGTLQVQTYIGGAWVTYETKVLGKADEWVYSINREMVILRCIYTPVANETIGYAEIQLRP